MIVTPAINRRVQATIPRAKNPDAREEAKARSAWASTGRKVYIDITARAASTRSRYISDEDLQGQLTTCTPPAHGQDLYSGPTRDRILTVQQASNRPQGGVRVVGAIAEQDARRIRKGITDAKRRLRGLSSDINVTPMIDVLLVLLIIFMITRRVSRRNRRAGPARAEEPAQAKQQQSDQIVLELLRTLVLDQPAAGRVRPVGREVPRALRSAPRQVLFIKAHRTEVRDIVKAMDVAAAQGCR